MTLWLWAALAAAEAPPPDYRAVLTEAAGSEIARAGRERGPEGARELAERWMRTFGKSARVSYELGLALRLAGNDADALAYLEDAVRLDPDLAAARYDRGEVRLADGDLKGAAEDFEAVTRLMPEAWPGWFRRAELAGRAEDPRLFGEHLQKALRFGFSARAVASDPTWRGFLAHERIGPVFRRLVSVYQGDAAIDHFFE